jgi:hypothetical protein
VCLTAAEATTNDNAVAAALLLIKEAQDRVVEQLDQQFKALGMELRAGLPQIVHERITPSQASGKPASEFCALLSQLGLPPEVDDANSIFKKRKDGRNDFVYDWEQKLSSLDCILEMQAAVQDIDDQEVTPLRAEKIQLEPRSYAPLCDYLRGLEFDAVVVGNGQNLPNKILYSVQAFSMRKEKNVHGQKVFYVKTIEGLTDLVVLDSRGKPGQVTRERVKFAIEVKLPTELKDNSTNADGSECAGTKEKISQSVITQLLGLNMRNPYNAPPVLLTNLCRSNFVYYITEHEVHPWFRIARQQCSTFLAGLQFVEGILKHNRCTGDFGRPCSPDMQT